MDIVVTSPPYWSLRTYGAPNEIGNERTPGRYVLSLLFVLHDLKRVLKPGGSVFLVMGDKYVRTGGCDRKSRGMGADPGGRANTRPVQRGVDGISDGSLLGMPYRVALAAIDEGWIWRQDIVWHKPNPLPESVRRRCVRSHETVIHLTLTAQHYARPVARGGELGHDVWNHSVGSYRDPEGARCEAVYPPSLVGQILDGWCPPGGLVLDPFSGSGTTAAVARKSGYRVVAMDSDPVALGVTKRRTGGPAMSPAVGDATRPE